MHHEIYIYHYVSIGEFYSISSIEAQLGSFGGEGCFATDESTLQPNFSSLSDFYKSDASFGLEDLQGITVATGAITAEVTTLIVTVTMDLTVVAVMNPVWSVNLGS